MSDGELLILGVLMRHIQAPRVITVDNNPTFQPAFEQLINNSILII